MCARQANVEESAGEKLLELSDFHRTLADLFHLLSQPLTGLSCSLALSLNHVTARRWGRRELETAYEKVNVMTRLNTGIRALVDADDSRPEEDSSEVDEMLAELVDELKPVALAKGVELRLTENDPTATRLGTDQFRRAMFHLLDCGIHVSARKSRILVSNQIEGATCALRLRLSPDRQTISEIRGATSSSSGAARADSLKWRLPLAIARRIFENAGARFQADIHKGRLTLRCVVPLAQEAIQPLTPPLRRPA